MVIVQRLGAFAKTKAQISFAVIAKLISAFVFATRIIQSLSYLYPKFQASIHLLRLYRPVCVKPSRKPRRQVFASRLILEYKGECWYRSETSFLQFKNCVQIRDRVLI